MTQNIEDQCSDEDLIKAHKAGDPTALNILFQRYLKPLKFRLLWKSRYFKDDESLDDFIQDIFVRIIIRLSENGFEDRGPGSFRAWAFGVANNVCWSEERHLIRQPISISDTHADAADNLISRLLPDEPVDHNRIINRAKELLNALPPEEQHLLELVSNGVKAKDILKDSMFSKYSLDYLKHKICNIRKKLTQIDGHPDPADAGEGFHNRS